MNSSLTTKSLSIACGLIVFALTLGHAWAQTNQPAATPNANPPSIPADVTQALQMSAGPDQAKAVGTAATQWAKTDPYAFVTWAAAQPPNIFALVRGSGAACGLSTAPETAANWLATQNTDQTKGLLHVMLIRWTLTTPAAAEAWCATSGLSKDVRYLAYFTVGDGLCRKDPALATAWAAQLPPGDDHLAAIHGIALIWARGNIASTTAWIKQLNPQDMKWAALAVAETWGMVKGGGPSLEGWLDQLSLSATDKAEVLKGPHPDEYHYSKYQPNPSPAAH